MHLGKMTTTRKRTQKVIVVAATVAFPCGQNFPTFIKVLLLILDIYHYPLHCFCVLTFLLTSPTFKLSLKGFIPTVCTVGIWRLP